MNTPLDQTEYKQVRHIYKSMLMARVLENKLRSLYKAGKIVGGVYLGTGQEAVSASIGSCLRPGKDVFAPLIRDQAGRTAFGEEIIDCTRTYLGSALGPMRGRDGNIHRGRPSDGVIAMISHLGASISVVNGTLLARRLRGELDGVVGATCIGDGCTSTGAFHEALNIAAVEKLPLILVVANNQYAYSTSNRHQFACNHLVDKAPGYGVRGVQVDGTDMLACYKVMKEAVSRARSGDGPQLVVADLLRLTGHGEHDDAFYISESLKTSKLGRDCMDVAYQQMIDAGVADENELQAWQNDAEQAVLKAVAQAQKEPDPDPHRDDWRVFASERSQDGAFIPSRLSHQYFRDNQENEGERRRG